MSEAIFVLVKIAENIFYLGIEVRLWLFSFLGHYM